ncbi:Pogo transposable element, partial [Aspergillus sclerotialis]
MANLLLAKRESTSIQPIGEKWVYNFIKRHDQLKTRFSRRYDYQRAKNEDPKTIREWFDRVQQAIIQYGVQPDDIYNFDETGFAMGLISTAKVVTRAEYYGRRSILQPGNRNWVT